MLDIGSVWLKDSAYLNGHCIQCTGHAFLQIPPIFDLGHRPCLLYRGPVWVHRRCKREHGVWTLALYVWQRSFMLYNVPVYLTYIDHNCPTWVLYVCCMLHINYRRRHCLPTCLLNVWQGPSTLHIGPVTLPPCRALDVKVLSSKCRYIRPPLPCTKPLYPGH